HHALPGLAAPPPPDVGGPSGGGLDLGRQLSGAIDLAATALSDAVTSLATTAGPAARTANAAPGDHASSSSNEGQAGDATAQLTAADIGPVKLGVPGLSEAGLPVASTAVAVERFIWPVDSRRISTLFGPAHQAIDIDEWPAGGNPVRAIADGIVTFA